MPMFSTTNMGGGRSKTYGPPLRIAKVDPRGKEKKNSVSLRSEAIEGTEQNKEYDFPAGKKEKKSRWNHVSLPNLRRNRAGEVSNLLMGSTGRKCQTADKVLCGQDR